MLVICALIVTVLLVRREVDSFLAERPPGQLRHWEDMVRDRTQVGDPEAPVTAIVFADFQCPYCAQAASALDSLRSRAPGGLSLVHYRYPLDNIHPHARTAAIAAECTADMGRFDSYLERCTAGSVPSDQSTGSTSSNLDQ